jgi:hypothetical protein
MGLRSTILVCPLIAAQRMSLPASTRVTPLWGRETRMIAEFPGPELLPNLRRRPSEIIHEGRTPDG